MNRRQEGERSFDLGTELSRQAQTLGLIFYRAVRYPRVEGDIIFNREAKRVRFEPIPQGENVVKIHDFDPQQAEAYLPDWNYQPNGPTVSGSGRPEGGEFLQSGWLFTRTFEGAEYSLDVVSKYLGHRWVSLSTGGKTELQVNNIDQVQMDANLGQLSFLGRGGSYHITDQGMTHFIQSPDHAMSARKYFKPQI